VDRGFKKGQNRVVSFRERESRNYKDKKQGHKKKIEEEKEEDEDLKSQERTSCSHIPIEIVRMTLLFP
jgi:tRNA threonylcarbamoyladenosine modification (KEOPS) complex Cgi121 subunit